MCIQSGKTSWPLLKTVMFLDPVTCEKNVLLGCIEVACGNFDGASIPLSFGQSAGKCGEAVFSPTCCLFATNLPLPSFNITSSCILFCKRRFRNKKQQVYGNAHLKVRIMQAWWGTNAILPTGYKIIHILRKHQNACGDCPVEEHTDEIFQILSCK